MMLDAQPDIDVVGEAANGKEVLAQVGDCDPDVVVMDIQMPQMDGIEATRRLVDRRSGLCPGADHLRPGRVRLPRALRRGLRVHAQGRDQRTTGRGGPHRVRWTSDAGACDHPTAHRRLLQATQTTRSGRPPQRLSDRELDVVRELAKGKSNAEIASTSSSAKPPSRATSPTSDQARPPRPRPDRHLRLRARPHPPLRHQPVINHRGWEHTSEPSSALALPGAMTEPHRRVEDGSHGLGSARSPGEAGLVGDDHGLNTVS